jgi:hypothetical protein
MPTAFDSISDGFYTAFFEPDPVEREEAIEAWIKESTPVIQSAVEDDLRAYLEGILEATWTEKGWEARATKFCGLSQGLGRKANAVPFTDAYKVRLDVTVTRRASRDIVVGSLTPEVRSKTNAAIEAAKTAIAKREPPSPVALREIDLHGKTVDEAIPVVEAFLKECYRDNVRRVRVIHGKGIFVLQKAIREYLVTHRFVKSGSIASADKDHGGEGATEAALVDFSADLLD